MRHSLSYSPSYAGRTWTKRHDAAAALLDDTAQMISLARAVDVTDPHQPPCVLWASGDRLARSATRVGLFAGSFNPLTNAHIALTDAARKAMALDLIVWSLAVSTVDKEQVTRASIGDRLAQLIAFTVLSSSDAVALLNRGLYVDQVRAVRSKLAGDATLTALVGFDKVVQIFDPRYYEDRDAALAELFEVATLAVSPREGAGEAEVHALLSRPENERFALYVSFFNVAQDYAGDSSTEARMLASQDGSSKRIHALLPPEGAALLETRAFAPPKVHDEYEWRQRWLQMLVGLSGPVPAHLPGLSALVGWTCADDSRGARLRGWLAAATGGSHSWAKLRRLLQTPSLQPRPES